MGEPYPRLEWRSEIGSVVREGPTFALAEREQITARTHPAVGFQLTRVELYGRLEDGQVPVELSEHDVRIESTPGSKSADLLASVMPLVDAATASGADAGHTLPRGFAFNLFGQGVAFFQSAHTLIKGGQPVEALPSLRGLTTIAARFEQLSDPNGAGLGVVVRLVLDSVEEVSSDPTQAAEKTEALLSGARRAGIVVPEALPGPETTTVWHSLRAEMELARGVWGGSYATAELHVKRPEGEPWRFHTRLESSPLTDLIASACVVAQLRLLQGASEFFGWTIEAEKVDELLARAQELNEASANPEEEDPSG